jgi:hypothetical protein
MGNATSRLQRLRVGIHLEWTIWGLGQNYIGEKDVNFSLLLLFPSFPVVYSQGQRLLI